ncbi:hypothetical protein ANANG_G00278850 [Anguilla anguilla]|uniref:FH2 domain-containing protein n=1 Tax=Anguilla anguilla TaxID=7936 RepID=A0A9D3LN35_ANGAN|nr:hypothetical protein ANANG_G00278850 [Anguilla anguilla]
MKRLNWSKIRPQEMSESCFWIMANEDKYENADLLAKLAHTFGSQKLARREEDDLEEKKSIKKRIKELKVLDPKIAQNLSIFLGSFRMPYQEIRRIVLEVDEEQLSEPMIQNLVKHLPEQEQLNALVKYKHEYANLSEPEQFGVVMSSVKRLRPRLSSILFRLQFEEQVNNVRPDVLAVSAACEEVRRSRGFRTLLELVLLIGNYMNAGSRNAQSYGFDLSSLCKLKDTKSADQKQTLLHFLAEACEESFPEVLRFAEDLQHVERASRVSAENLERNLKQMERQIAQLERDLETFSSEEPQDMFVSKMSISFLTCSCARVNTAVRCEAAAGFGRAWQPSISTYQTRSCAPTGRSSDWLVPEDGSSFRSKGSLIRQARLTGPDRGTAHPPPGASDGLPTPT